MERRRADQQAELERIEERVAAENPDDTTRREALELELMDRERSEAGELLDLEEDVGGDA